jgi:serine/threonine protein kinase
MKFYEEFEELDSKFLVCEFCNGGTLENYIEESEKIETEEGLKIIYEIAIGISFLHKNNVTHRDLKGDNILIHNGKYKIGDFGFSNDNKLMQTTLGTPLFMAPEIVQTKNDKYNNKVDVWALGVLLYYTLTKEFPFYSTRQMDLYKKIATDKFKIERKYKKKWDSNLQNLFELCFQKNPNNRLSIDEFLNHKVFDKINKAYKKIIHDINMSIKEHGKTKKELFLMI